MEEKRRQCNSVSSQSNFLVKTLSHLSILSSDPLFSSIVTMYALIFLYFPGLFLGIVFSPVLMSTGILLFLILRFGAIQRIEEDFDSSTHDSPPAEEDRKWVSSGPNSELKSEMGLDSEPNSFCADSIVEWNSRGPLEIIYEEYEGEEDEEEDEGEGKEDDDDVGAEGRETRVVGTDRYPSLSLYYSESDLDSSSDGEFPAAGGSESPESVCFRWDEEEDREGLIEIALDGKRASDETFHSEEDNLIEIDISPARTPARVWSS